MPYVAKTTDYQRLQKVKSKYCKGKATKEEVQKSAQTYIDRAVSKGKKKAEAKAIAQKVLDRACTVNVTVKSTTKPSVSGNTKRLKAK